jgi:predicted nucleotide-binding protein
MDLSRKLVLLDEQIAAANNGTPKDFHSWRAEADMVLRMVMGELNNLYFQFRNVRYRPGVVVGGTNTAAHKEQGVLEAVSLLKAAKRELELREEQSQGALAAEVEDLIDVSDKGETGDVGRIFIVHGHDDAKKFELARFLKGLTSHDPVILHEQPNKGAVLIEKLEASAARTGFAVVLLTGDDLGRAKAVKKDKPRGRQNVVFELGFFIGAFGRTNVAVLKEDGVEEPGDVTGLVYTPLDANGAWKTALAKEIQEAGIPVDWSALGR